WGAETSPALVLLDSINTSSSVNASASLARSTAPTHGSCAAASAELGVGLVTTAAAGAAVVFLGPEVLAPLSELEEGAGLSRAMRHSRPRDTGLLVCPRRQLRQFSSSAMAHIAFGKTAGDRGMTFRVDTSGGDWRDRRAAILSAEAAAIAAGCALIWYSVHSAGRWLFLVALGEILFSVGYGTWVGFRAGVRVLKSQLQFDLTETELAASRAGHPTVRIELSKIDRIQESREWLTVCSLRPYRRIGIPVEVKGFATLK